VYGRRWGDAGSAALCCRRKDEGTEFPSADFLGGGKEIKPLNPAYNLSRGGKNGFNAAGYSIKAEKNLFRDQRKEPSGLVGGGGAGWLLRALRNGEV